MIKIIDSEYNLFLDDPVRPHLSAEFRTTENRKAFALMDEDGYNVRAVVCVAFTDKVATTEEELTSPGAIAMFYTVWSYKKGAGREIIFETVNWIKENLPLIERFVTLSPQTNMAYKFHTRNGAEIISVNDTSINYEYASVVE